MNKEGKEYWVNHLQSQTETELGLLYEAKTERPNASYVATPNSYQEAKEGSDDAYQKAKARAIERETRCWNCREDISTSSDGICPECDYAIKCSNCKKCACDKPDTKIKKKHKPFDEPVHDGTEYKGFKTVSVEEQKRRMEESKRLRKEKNKDNF